jgi:uroporphyrinogen decarboxylase
MPEYRRLRAKHELLDLIRDPDLAAEITLQPVRAFGVDAAILFADILPILEPLGLPVRFVPGRGPVLDAKVGSRADLARLGTDPAACRLPFTMAAARRARDALPVGIPLLGFSGAPFTLACYAIEGGASRDYLSAKRFLLEEPKAWHRLMELLSAAVAEYTCGQVEAGADAVQLFDSWAGVLDPDTYETCVLPYNRRIMDALRCTGVPRIYFSTGTSGFLHLLSGLGADVVGVDWRIEMGEARRRLGADLAVQGNLDPALLLAPVPTLERAARRILETSAAQPGFIFNLGHGVLKQTPVHHVQALVDLVHAFPLPRGEPT